MSRSDCNWLSPGAVSALVMMCLCIGTMLTGCGLEGTAARLPGPRRQVVLAFKYALYAYQCEYGRLPYDPRGEAAALYKLRRFVDVDRLPPVEGRPRMAFDEKKEMLVGSPFRYLNRPGVALDEVAPDLIILAERKEYAVQGRWLLCADGGLTFERCGRYGVGDIYPLEDRADATR